MARVFGGAWRCAAFSITYLSGLRLHLNNPQSGINRRIHQGTAAADSDGWLRPLPPFAVPPPPSPPPPSAPGQEVTRTLGRNTCSKWTAGRLQRFCMMERFGAMLLLAYVYASVCACACACLCACLCSSLSAVSSCSFEFAG